MIERRYLLDPTVQRHGTTVIGGSPLKLFRLTPAGVELIDRIADGVTVCESRLVDALLDAGAIHPAIDDASPSPFTEADVTAVVPTLGPPAHLPRGAVVVDDGSRPPIAGADIRLDRNRGPGAARNAGLVNVTTPLVAFVDTDVELPTGWLEHLLPHFADERVALVAPRVCSRLGSSIIARYDARHSPLDLGDQPARVRAGSVVSYVPAAAIVCRVEAIRSVGGFDETLRFGEDVDLVWRLDGAGWRVRYEPTSVVEHDPRSSWLAWWRQRVSYGSSAAPLARRHPGKLAPLRTSGWSVGAWLLGVAGHPISGIAVGLGSSAALVRKLRDVPAGDAFRLAALGNARAGDQIAEAVRRAWWPVLGIAAIRSATARRVLAAAAMTAKHPLRLADDVAYSVGLWSGIADERTLDPLLPEIRSWPGRSRAPRAPSADLR